MPRRWQASPFLKTSAVLHAAAGIGAAVSPQSWPIALALVAANHGLITWGGLWPRSRLLGPNLTRLPAAAAARGEVALTFDDGPNPEITPHVLDMLDAAGAKASFFCVGVKARAHPALIRDMVGRGHGIENHTDRHPNHFAALGPRAMAREVVAAQHCLADLTGRPPRFFRAVAGLRNVFLEPILARHDLQLATWSHRAFDTVYGEPAQALRRLAQHRAPGDILLLHDGHCASTPSGQPIVLDILPVLLDELKRAQLTPVRLDRAVP